MADKSADKQELRRKLASMKKDYARTLRSVEKSEKAKRARSHVQRKLAEQAQLTSTSPSCTHTFSRRTDLKPDTSTDGPLQQEKTRGGGEERDLKSLMATRRQQRQRRSVSFIIPKETPSERDGEVERREGHLGASVIKRQDEQLGSKSKRLSLPGLSSEVMLGRTNDSKMSFVSKAVSINDTSGCSKLGTHTGREDRTKSKENVVLIVPESQFSDSLGEGNPERDVTPGTLHPLISSHPQKNAKIRAEDKQILDLPSGKLYEETTKSSSISKSQEVTHCNSTNNYNACKADEKIETFETSPKPPQVGIRKRRAGRRSLKHSRKPRELTASDISMKEVVQSQSAEEGSHTWIEGLMYPVEYYVRRTRSMTSSQSSQSQSYPSSQRYMDRNGSMRDIDTQLSAAEQKNSLTDSTRSKDLPIPHTKAVDINQSDTRWNQLGLSQHKMESTSRAPTEASRNPTESSRSLTEASNFPSESESDSLRSQLSESLLKTSVPRAQDCVAGQKGDNDKMKLSRQTKTRKLQRRRVIWKGSSSRKSLSKNSVNDKMTFSGEDSAFTPNSEDSKSISGHTSLMQEPQSSGVTPDLCQGSTTDVSSLDLRSNSGTEDDERMESHPGCTAGSILPALNILRLRHSDFALPDEDFATLKEAKLKTLQEASKAAKLKCDDRDTKKPSPLPLLVPKVTKENVNAKTDKSENNPKSIPADHRHKNSSDQLVTGPSCTPTQDKVISQVTHNRPIKHSDQSDRTIAENSSTELAPPFSEAPHIKQTRINHQEDTDSDQLSLDPGTPARSCNSGKIQPGSVSIQESPDKNVLHSQFSLTQFHDSCSLAFPKAGCTPGFSPSSSIDETDGVTLTRNTSQSPQDTDLKSRVVEVEDLGDGDHKVDSCLDSKLDEVVDGSLPSRPLVTSPCNPANLNYRSNLQQHTVFAYPSPSNQITSLKEGGSCLAKAIPHENSTGNQLTVDQPTNDVTVGTNNGSITPPSVHPDAGRPVPGNINQKSPFAGGATGSPFGTAEEPKAMSQCGVKILNEDNEEEEERVTKSDLALGGCLQLDLPWEPSPAVRDVASGVVNMDGGASIVVLVYQRSLVIWRYHEGTNDWEILQCWVVSKEEEFSLVRCLSSTKQNEVSLVLAGKFASCAVRILTFDTLTKELQTLDVNLSQTLDYQVPYLLCTTSQQDIIVAVKDTKNKTTLFSVQASIASSNVDVVELANGCDAELTSLLQIEETTGIVMATTSHNHLLLWCLKTSELIKNVPIKPVASGSRVSCLEASVESDLLFLILVYRDDVNDVEAKYESCVGAVVAFNPHTDKMVKMIEYNLPIQHEHASFVDGVLHRDTLLAKLSDGSLHRWEITTGNLLNYSLGHPTNQRLRTAQLCNSEVVLIETDQYLQIYD